MFFSSPNCIFFFENNKVEVNRMQNATIPIVYFELLYFGRVSLWIMELFKTIQIIIEFIIIQSKRNTSRLNGNKHFGECNNCERKMYYKMCFEYSKLNSYWVCSKMKTQNKQAWTKNTVWVFDVDLRQCFKWTKSTKIYEEISHRLWVTTDSL